MRLLCRRDLPCRARRRLGVVVKPPPGLAAEPAGLEVFHPRRARPVLAVRQPVVQHRHDGQTRTQPDEIREFQRPHRVIGAELQCDVDARDRPDARIQRLHRLVIIGTGMRMTMDAGKSSDTAVILPTLGASPLTAWKVGSSVAMPRMTSTSFMTGTRFMKCTPVNFAERSGAASAGT